MCNLLFVYGTKELKVPNLLSRRIVETLVKRPAFMLTEMGLATTWGKVKEPIETVQEFLLPDLSDSVEGEVYKIEGDLTAALRILDLQTGLLYERRLIELNFGDELLSEAWGYLASSWAKEGKISFSSYGTLYSASGGWAC